MVARIPIGRGNLLGRPPGEASLRLYTFAGNATSVCIVDPLLTEVGAPTRRNLAGRSLPTPIRRGDRLVAHLGAHILVCILCRLKSALPVIAGESQRSQSAGNATSVCIYWKRAL